MSSHHLGWVFLERRLPGEKSALEQIAAERAQHALAWTIVWPVSANQIKLSVEHIAVEVNLDDSPRGWESLAAEMGEKRSVIRKACAEYMLDNGQRLRSAQRKKPGEALQYDSRTLLLDRLIATISFLDEGEALAYIQSVRSLEPTSAKGSFPLLNDFLRPTTPWRQVMAVVTQARDEEDEQLRRAWAWQVRSEGPQAGGA